MSGIDLSKKKKKEISPEFMRMRKRLLELQQKEIEKYRKQALQKAKKVAALLKEKYQVKKVFLYGSLAWGGFNKHSDIDLYLVGFKGNYWRAYVEAEKIASPIEISLACEEDAFDSLKEKVHKRGILL
ncbi:MAG: nucleotidyltransferase domain-containing protein [Syntrophomonadaceae bacterium]|nr:nucleotidyltransferase domain-containing protein [Syntrophomonadaceae bacterium]